MLFVSSGIKLKLMSQYIIIRQLLWKAEVVGAGVECTFAVLRSDGNIFFADANGGLASWTTLNISWVATATFRQCCHTENV